MGEQVWKLELFGALETLGLLEEIWGHRFKDRARFERLVADVKLAAW
jgi:hypothetical protein